MNIKIHQTRNEIQKKKNDPEMIPDFEPEYNRYSIGKLDLVLCSSRGRLYKTMDYRTWRKIFPTKKIKNIEI